jgi:Invasin, domain 3
LRTIRRCGRRGGWRSRSCALALLLTLGAVLPTALSPYLLPFRAEAAGPTATITVALSPSSIVADGVSTSTATASLRFGGSPLPGQTVVFASSDSGIHFGPTIDNLDGTYAATLTSSTSVGAATITATSGWAGQMASGQATLTQIPGPAKSIALTVAPSSIIADATSLATATATVADAYGNPVRTDTVVFVSSDPHEQVMEVANNGNGTYSAVIRSSTTPGHVAIEATDTAANLSAHSELRQTASGSTAGASTLSQVTMQWAFHYTPTYTNVLYLAVDGASPGTSVLVNCHGGGCPFAKHLTLVSIARRCVRKAKRRCASNGTVDLTPEFRKHRLQSGSHITIAITQPQSMGKYYRFTVRAGHAPRLQVTCLVPGATRRGAPC